MNERILYLNIYTPISEHEEFDSDHLQFVPWKTVLALYVLDQSKLFSTPSPICINLVPLNVVNPADVFPIKKRFIDKEGFNVLENTLHDPIVSSCALPILFLPGKNLYITGLCSVLRCLIKESSPHFLGYLEGCLKAPAEASPWTSFCEVDLSEALIDFFSSVIEDVITVPRDFARFEAHLQSPVRIHNLRKKMQTDEDWANECSKAGHCRSDALDQYAKWIHTFAEGPDCFLSDLLIFPHIHLMLEQVSFSISQSSYESLLPNISRWYSKMKGCHMADKVLNDILDLNSVIIGSAAINIILPEVAHKSLYKLETSRGSSRKTYTRQNGIEKVITKLEESLLMKVIKPSDDFEPFISGKPIDWDSMPRAVHPSEGNLPLERVTRKCQQLENMASAIVKVADKGSIIVDFCSGGGHLGILLAYLMPDSTVILLENKAESLDNAVKRISELHLKNCIIFQGNMNNFLGHFDIGTSLHACGVATDLVIAACARVSASFVVCPCCYGSAHEIPSIRYPRSKHFVNSGVTLEDYLVLGHTADQTEVNTDKHDQGIHAMNIVDSDRLHFIIESGYKNTQFVKMKPESCSPKNNMIIAKKTL